LKQPSPDIKPAGAFTLLELLVAAAVFTILAAILLTVTSQTAGIFEKAQAQKNRQQIARIALEAISRDLEAAALPLGTSQVDTLAFVVNPAGLDQALLAPHAAFWQVRSSQSSHGFLDVGYFIRWNGADAELCRLQVPPDDGESILANMNRALNDDLVERLAPGTSSGADIKGLMSKNVIGLWLIPRDQSGKEIALPYDSRLAADSRPSFVDVSIAVIDTATASKLTDAGQIRSHYPAGAEKFAAELPPAIRQGVQVFTKRVPIHGDF
jgi:prepilin-type N-terminal cleavage/methylation domain-containing protein